MNLRLSTPYLDCRGETLLFTEGSDNVGQRACARSPSLPFVDRDVGTFLRDIRFTSSDRDRAVIE